MSRCVPLTDGGISLPWFCCERRFVVEQVDVGEAFALEEAEHALGFGGEVGQAGRAACRRRRASRPRGAMRGRAARPAPCCRCRAGGGAEEGAASGQVLESSSGFMITIVD